MQRNEDTSRAAVLIPLLKKDDVWHMLFQQRALDIEMQPGDVEEIDSLEELVRLDPGYSAYLKEKNHKGGAQA